MERGIRESNGVSIVKLLMCVKKNVLMKPVTTYSYYIVTKDHIKRKKMP